MKKYQPTLDPSHRTLEHRMEEDVSSSGNVFGFSAFDLVMADTVFTGMKIIPVGTTWLI